MARLRSGGWVEALRRAVQEDGRPLLGICLGMQMLAGFGEEGGAYPGLGLIDGRVRRLDALGCTLRVPHVGWNEVQFRADDPLFAHLPQCSDFYFVHSYAFDGQNSAVATGWTDYGVALVAAIHSGNVFGTQFHPEKSSRAGRQVLRNFLDIRSC
jgi:glutamine amidotransferase